MKALGTGIRGVGWKDIQVTRSRGGPPAVVLHARGAARAERMGVRRWLSACPTPRNTPWPP